MESFLPKNRGLILAALARNARQDCVTEFRLAAIESAPILDRVRKDEARRPRNQRHIRCSNSVSGWIGGSVGGRDGFARVCSAL